MPFKRFLANDESGAIALDVVVLTALLVGTTLAVVGTVSDGVETLSIVGPHVQLREEAADVRFDGDLCNGGIEALQAQEDARAQAELVAPVDVADYMRATYADLSADAIRAEFARAQDAASGATSWTIERTRLGAVECELVLRGLD